MSLQHLLNEQSMKSLPQIHTLIKNTRSKETRDYMFNYAIREMLNSYKAVCDMTKTELSKFENEIIESFKFKELI